MPTRTFKNIGVDVSSVNPLPTDWKLYINDVLVQNYLDQPNIARKFAPLIIPLEYDGRTEAEIPQINDIDQPEIGMEPGIADTELEGDIQNVKTPQIYQTVKLSTDRWKQVFASQDRAQLVLGRVAEKIQNMEDVYTFRGKTGISNGLITDATTLGSPSGVWGSNTNGRLTNFLTDIKTILSNLDAQGVPAEYPVDVGLTSYAFTLINSTMYDYDPNTSNRMVAEKMLRGGKFYQSDNLQASVSSTSNTMFVSVRTPSPKKMGWALLASGFDMEEEKMMWGRRVGIRQKVGSKVLNGKLVWKMTSISTATS